MSTPSNPSPQPNRRPEACPPAGADPRSVTSAELLGAARELLIVHAGRQYRLRLTQNGKLILTA